MSLETAVLGGGCFWCTEAVFKQLRGVHQVKSGYAGGHVQDPSYEAVCDGGTGHIEVVAVTFDPAEISYRQVLEVFFGTHDPTTEDRQGNDVGTQYRSAVFYQSQAQHDEARALIDELTRDEVFDAPIVTRLLPEAPFWPAEQYHDNYFARNPGQSYCAAVVGPKVAKFRKRFAALLVPADQ